VSSTWAAGQFVKDASGNVGVGIASPTQKLDVAGALRVAVASTTAQIKLERTTTAAGHSWIGASSSSLLEVLDSTYATKFKIDQSGNLGLGVTPSAWSGFTAFQLPNGGYFAGGGGYTNFTTNVYNDGSQKYINSGAYALSYQQHGDGAHKWYTAPTGTAGNPISFTQAMTLSAGGNLGVGTTFPVVKLEANGDIATSIGSGGNLILRETDPTRQNLLIAGADANGSYLNASYSTGGAAVLRFQTANIERVRIDASGDLTTTNGRINLITVGRGGGGVASNTASGYAALYSNTTGASNTASGYAALYSNTTGVNNTASGLQALQSNTTGYNNTASGVSALYYNTTGVNNTASGGSALQSNTTGVNNTASGLNALYSNTTGDNNTASGYAALYSNTTGASNTASGYAALYSNTTGVNNTASGLQALHYNTTGYNNTASGLQALYYNTTGVNNTASGGSALYYNTTGYNNTASGRSGYNPDNDIAQYRITTDFDMTLVGYGATKDNAGQLWNSTAIGARAKVTKSNQVVLGDSNVTETLVNGDLVQKVSTTAATLDTNGTLTFSIVDNSTLRVSVRGSDGTTRTATLALT
jgi:hypothetical protein